jgi:hypothetical protein
LASGRRHIDVHGQLPAYALVVATDDVEARASRLENLLDEAVALLEKHGETYWAAWMATCRRTIAAGDAYGVDYLLSAFGGMGSFNDVLLLRANGNTIDESEEAFVNTRLEELRTDIWSDATEIRRSIDSSSS